MDGYFWTLASTICNYYRRKAKMATRHKWGEKSYTHQVFACWCFSTLVEMRQHVQSLSWNQSFRQCLDFTSYGTRICGTFVSDCRFQITWYSYPAFNYAPLELFLRPAQTNNSRKPWNIRCKVVEWWYENSRMKSQNYVRSAISTSLFRSTDDTSISSSGLGSFTLKVRCWRIVVSRTCLFR